MSAAINAAFLFCLFTIGAWAHLYLLLAVLDPLWLYRLQRTRGWPVTRTMAVVTLPPGLAIAAWIADAI